MVNVVAFESGYNQPHSKEAWVTKVSRSQVFEVYKDWHPVIQTYIGLMDEEPSRWALYDRLPCSSWVFEKGKVVLMGDAAHVRYYKMTLINPRLCFHMKVKADRNQWKTVTVSPVV